MATAKVLHITILVIAVGWRAGARARGASNFQLVYRQFTRVITFEPVTRPQSTGQGEWGNFAPSHSAGHFNGHQLIR